MNCALCKREAGKASGLCEYHGLAKVKVIEGFEAWKLAYGEISWSAYLDRIKRSPETGQWAKEIAGMLEKQGE
jgi:hypothetical protein